LSLAAARRLGSANQDLGTYQGPDATSLRQADEYQSAAKGVERSARTSFDNLSMGSARALQTEDVSAVSPAGTSDGKSRLATPAGPQVWPGLGMFLSTTSLRVIKLEPGNQSKTLSSSSALYTREFIILNFWHSAAGPASKAGIRVGDAIKRLNGKPVTSPHSLVAAVRSVSTISPTSTFAVLRDGIEMQVNVSLQPLLKRKCETRRKVSVSVEPKEEKEEAQVHRSPHVKKEEAQVHREETEEAQVEVHRVEKTSLGTVAKSQRKAFSSSCSPSRVPTEQERTNPPTQPVYSRQCANVEGAADTSHGLAADTSLGLRLEPSPLHIQRLLV